MTYTNATAAILVGDCIARMRELPAGFARTCVTSPPYYGLRDYGVDGQIGLEETPEIYVARLVDVFREVHRLLADKHSRQFVGTELNPDYAAMAWARIAPIEAP